MYGILLVCIYTFMLNQVLVTGKSKIQLMIISKRNQEIKELILSKYDRGTTLFHIKGGYTGNADQAVMTVIDQRELFPINEDIKKMDRCLENIR